MSDQVNLVVFQAEEGIGLPFLISGWILYALRPRALENIYKELSEYRISSCILAGQCSAS